MTRLMDDVYSWSSFGMRYSQQVNSSLNVLQWGFENAEDSIKLPFIILRG